MATITKFADIRKGSGKFATCQLCHDFCIVYEPTVRVHHTDCTTPVEGPLDNKGRRTCLLCMTRVLKDIQKDEPDVSITLDGEAL